MNNTPAFKISSLLGLCTKTNFPGTLASLVALFVSFFVYYFSNGIVYFMMFLALVYFGFWSISKLHKENGEGDYQYIGIDEVVGMWIANFFLFELDFDFGTTLLLAFISFAIFRILDIWKGIPPIKNINENGKQNSFRVMMDDIVAGVYTYFIMLVILGVYDVKYLYFSFLVLLPAMVANMAPTIVKINLLNKPISEKWFGKNKTWRGFVVAIIFGTIVYILLEKFNLINIIGDKNYVIFVGFMISLGAIGGDLIKSFFKRKMNIEPGGNFMPFDQVDFVIGMIILSYPFYKYNLAQIVLLLILGGSISALAHRIGYWLKINNDKQ